MSDDIARLAAALAPLTTRVRTDVTAVKKPSGEQAWTRQALTPERLARHLNGGPPRGVCPIQAGSDVTMVAVLDFDSHQGEVPWPSMCAVAHTVAEALDVQGMQPVAWRSSGGRGLHLYLMWDQPQPAAAVRSFLTDTLAACGLRNGTGGVSAGAVEVFPKQDKVPVGGFGNQFILPLAGKSELLEWVDLSDSYVEVPRDQVSATSWGPPSSTVPAGGQQQPETETRTTASPVDPSTGEALWRSALDVIPNGIKGAEDLDYDGWRNVVFAIHHETGGSGAGLHLAHVFSSRSPKYDPDFLENRVWPYAHSDRGGVITGRTIMAIAGRYGWHEPISTDDFDVIQEDGDEVQREDAGQDTTEQGAGGTAAPAQEANAEAPPSNGLVRGAIPEAKHLTTDQANANRLVDQFGKKVMVAAGRWHVYDGKRWFADEADIYRYGCTLSKIVSNEADEHARKAARLQGEIDEKMTVANDLLAQAKILGKDDPRFDELSRRADAAMASVKPEESIEAARAADSAVKLQKWSTKSEMKATVEAAIGLARKMLTIDARALDADRMALNCNNGTVDLFSGDIRPHRSKDLITKLVDIRYDESADSTKWQAIVADITGEFMLPAADRQVARFLQRWFGYCATGSVREQVMVVHWGSGRNGKSTIIETVRAVLGEYAGTAAPGLLTNDGKGFERHPTEVASLLGKRMITAHENEDGAALREGFIKQATGGDQLKARFMREDFFDFDATHKLQLLTNHKPTIRGTDPGIWRRVLLVPYTQSFGSVEQFERGEVTRVADKLLGEALKGDPAMLRSVLAWVVAGAIEWAQHGLQPPEVVLTASRSYQDEMDRVGQFVRECCEVAPTSEYTGVYAGTAKAWAEPLTHGMGGLYPAYQSWCKEGGFHSLSRMKFVDSLKAALPACAVIEGMDKSGEKRRKVLRVFGLRLLSEE
jgi:P4 family phage/plasmid primase-like protien